MVNRPQLRVEGLADGLRFIVSKSIQSPGEYMMWKIVLRIGMSLLFSFALSGTSESATINSVSCSSQDVQSAIDGASSGDTVSVPAGSCTWATDINIVGKNVVLSGAGAGLSNITVGGATAVSIGDTASRLTGFTFTTNAAAQVVTVGNAYDWRLDHNTFTNISGANNVCVYVRGSNDAPHPTGVIDHNTFNNCRVYVIGDAGLTRGTLWIKPTGWGTNNGVFVESNTFAYTLTQGNCMDSQFSGITIFRFNQVTGCPIETHSTQNGFGSRSWEIYGNVSTPAANSVMATFLRGGTGIIFQNIFMAGWSQTVRMDNVRSFQAQPNPWNLCDGTDLLDGNIPAGGSQVAHGAGWPCRGQIGWGATSSLFVFGTPPYPPQASEPTPVFLNRTAGVQSAISIVNGAASHIVDCSDLQNERADFTGTCGTGVGIVANRPPTCSTGVYYWAIDEGEWNSLHDGADGQLYKCAAPNSWQLYYTPFSYPHPLTATAATQPEVPKNVHVAQP